jgi:hypothetical protein
MKRILARRRGSRWGKVHEAQDSIRGLGYLVGDNSQYVKEYEVADQLKQRPTKLSLSKHVGFTMKNRNK